MANKNLKKLLLELDPDEESQVLIDSMEEISDELIDVKAKLDALDVESVVEEAVTPIVEDIQQLKKDIKVKATKGEKGDPGRDGRDAEPPSDRKLVSLIKPLIPDPIKGDPGKDGKDGKDGKGVTLGEVLARVQGVGRGGSIDRQIFIGGVDPLKRYTDINLKAGSGVTLTYANNDTTKKVDVTITSTGGGGGTVRSINSISTSQTAGSTAGTDYVYLCTGTLTLTLPDAAANTNLYTVKNVGTGTITVNTTSAQTIDGAATQVMPIQFTSIDLISDTANWSIT